jgi:hypothetical protein
VVPIGFPQGSHREAATARYQIAGAWQEDGKGESIRERFAHTPGRTRRCGAIGGRSSELARNAGWPGEKCGQAHGAKCERHRYNLVEGGAPVVLEMDGQDP